ncbi:MAG TPA: GNAT family N-acetyltransferase [Thermomicrobiales bacterium]|jgi:predicted GNAT family acetyltransferase|nr:GNAT family N-acetyltransferase [Thermomicrobiales bacterium]
MSDATFIVTHDDQTSRYDIHEGSVSRGHIDYRADGQVIDMHHTEVDPSQQGRGIGSRLASGALDDVRSRGLKVVPSCPFIADYIERHPKYTDLIASS